MINKTSLVVVSGRCFRFYVIVIIFTDAIENVVVLIIQSLAISADALNDEPKNTYTVKL